MTIPPIEALDEIDSTNAEARVTNPFVMLASVPSDIVRYAKMKMM